MCGCSPPICSTLRQDGRVLTIKIYLKICGRPRNLLIKICGGPDRNLCFGQSEDRAGGSAAGGSALREEMGTASLGGEWLWSSALLLWRGAESSRGLKWIASRTQYTCRKRRAVQEHVRVLEVKIYYSEDARRR